MSKIPVVLHPGHPRGIDAALEACAGIALVRPQDDDGVARALQEGAEVLVTSAWRDDFLAPSLRWIAGTGAGVDQYPLPLLEAHAVTLTTAVGVHAIAVAEHAFALLLALTRRIGEAVRSMAGAEWPDLPGEELYGKRLAVIGLGRIGEGIAQRAKAWGLEVAGIKRRPETYSGCVGDVRGVEALRELCAWADIVVLSAPADPGGPPMIGAEELDALGAGWLVNVGRGSLVDQEALIAALATGRLRGAGLDVTTPEPLPASSPLWSSPKVVISAHNAGTTPFYGERWGRIFDRNLQAYQGRAAWVNRRIPGDGAA